MNKNRKIRHILPKVGMTALMAATAFAGMGTRFSLQQVQTMVQQLKEQKQLHSINSCLWTARQMYRMLHSLIQ